MKLNFGITLREFAGILDEKRHSRYVIWGAGECASDFVERLDKGQGFIAYYADKDEAKCGGV